MTEPALPTIQTPSRTTLVAILAVVAAVLLATVAGILVAGGGKSVRYEVETSGSSALRITYVADGNQSQLVPQADSSWSETVEFTGANQWAAVGADFPNGTATCRIFLNGKKLAESAGRGGALCETTIP
ncbi:MmpS family transport accessory protein [Actinoplanes sp. NPDC026619]|uniref:MmpS family transport accessory protein n=1 Tax=Actinoplanes sp. NPDC026619 TaxID=3155798 RepID=UPI0034052BD8